MIPLDIVALQYWHWWVLGIVLIILEIFVPGAFLLWLGIAAGITGLLTLLVPMTWQIQILLYAFFSVISAVVGWKWVYQRMKEHSSDQPRLNRRGEQYIGRTFMLTEAIQNGMGVIKVDDTIWRVSGEDCELGKPVRVIGVDGVILKVEQADTKD